MSSCSWKHTRLERDEKIEKPTSWLGSGTTAHITDPAEMFPFMSVEPAKGLKSSLVRGWRRGTGISAFTRLRHKVASTRPAWLPKEFSVSLGYIVSSRPTWAT